MKSEAARRCERRATMRCRSEVGVMAKLDRFDDDGKPRRQATSVEADDAFWYKRFPHKARAGFRGLTMEQKGFYAELIELVMEARGPLADNDVENARTFGCDIRQFRRIKAELLELERIKVEEGTLFDERAIRELVRAGLYSESQARRAKTRWRKKHQPPRVVALPVRPDLAPTIGPTVPATVAATVARNVGRTPNEINGPKHAEEKSREDSPSEPINPRATRPAKPPLRGGGAQAHGMTIDEWRADQLRRMGQAEQGCEGEQDEAPAPADRTARRG